MRYQFDTVEVQPAACAVLRNGQRLDLEPKAFRVLLYLIEHRDRAVAKDELIEAVWEGTAVTDNALTRIVAQLRRELGDDARSARYIQTLPTLGYRFIADLEVVMTARPQHSRTVLYLGAALLAVTLAGVTLFLAARPGAGNRPATPQPVQLTTSPGLDLNGSFSPDGNSFVYSSNRSGQFEIYTRTVKPGGADKRITADGRQNIEPAWSPDGKTIVYHSAALHGLWLVPAAGGTPRRLTDFGSAAVWSPDGRQIAFRSAEPFSLAWFDLATIGDSTIWVVAADGSQLRQLTTRANPPGQHAMPGWSKDGRHVGFVSFADPTELWSVDLASDRIEKLAPRQDLYFLGATRQGDFGIYHLPAAAQTPSEFYATRNDVPMGISVSPDGARLLFSRVANISQLWMTDANDAAARPIYADTVQRARVASFAPDGTRLAYVVQPEGRNTEIWMMNADGSGVVTVAGGPDPNMGPAWSADGNAILYTAYEEPSLRLRSVRPHTGVGTILFEAPRNTMLRPHVMPDLQAVVFDRPEPRNICIQPLRNGTPKQLTFDREGASFPVPSWDGHWIAYEAKRGDTVQIGIVDRNGAHPEILTADPALNWANSWASDNRRIAYASYRDGVWNLFWIDRVTRERKQITHNTAYGSFVRNPAWRPRTEQMVYEYSQVKGNIYMIDLR